MLFLRLLPLLALALAVAGCTSYTVGSAGESNPNGSYSGYTLNSPVTDQNPQVGGDSSAYPSSADPGKPLATPDKLDGR